MTDTPETEQDAVEILAQNVTQARENLLNVEPASAARIAILNDELAERELELAQELDKIEHAAGALTNAKAALAAHYAAPTAQDVMDGVEALANEQADDVSCGILAEKDGLQGRNSFSMDDEIESDDESDIFDEEQDAAAETETIPLEGSVTAEAALQAGKDDAIEAEREPKSAVKHNPWA